MAKSKKNNDKPTKKELDKMIEKEKYNFGCMLCEDFVGGSISAIYHHLKTKHQAKMCKGETYQKVDAPPKNAAAKKKRPHKNYRARKVVDEQGNVTVTRTPKCWEETDEAEELYQSDMRLAAEQGLFDESGNPDVTKLDTIKYLEKLESMYPSTELYLDEYAQEEFHGIQAGGDY